MFYPEVLRRQLIEDLERLNNLSRQIRLGREEPEAGTGQTGRSGSLTSTVILTAIENLKEESIESSYRVLKEAISRELGGKVSSDEGIHLSCPFPIL